MYGWLCRMALVAMGMALLGGCRSRVVQQRELAVVQQSYCVPVRTFVYDSLRAPRPGRLPAEAAALEFTYTHDELSMAYAAGILPMLADLARQEKEPETQARTLRMLDLRQQIVSRLLLTSIEIESLAAELDCEGERVDLLAAYLEDKDANRIRNLTIGSVVAGAVTTVATVVTKGQASIDIGITGGLLSAALGGAAAFSSRKRILVSHPRNLLADVWLGPVHSPDYPPLVWYVLNEPAFSNSGQMTMRKNIHTRWENLVLGGASGKQLALYFGAGGYYQAGDLHARADMLNQLQSSVRTIHQSLQGLMQRVAR